MRKALLPVGEQGLSTVQPMGQATPVLLSHW
jgi:hypothetical protein